MREFESYLKVTGWDSQFQSIQKLLDHLARKTKSESSRRHYLESVYALCKKQGMTSDQLVGLGKARAERAVQSLLDDMKREERSIRYINVTMAHLVSFFEVNGFKHAKKIEVERYYQPTRYRKMKEYIPTDEEIKRMAENAGQAKAKACVLSLYTSGVRNSTLRAILYGDLKAELDAEKYPVHVPIYAEMKKVDADACKNSLPYTTFFSKEAAIAIETYIDEFERSNPEKAIRPDEPLFQGKVRGRPMKRRTLEVMVKDAARRARIEKWRDVYPHCLRKAFERAVRNSGLDPKDQEFFMGHVLEGSADTYFDKTKLEEFRGKHAKVKFFPEKATLDDIDRVRAESEKAAELKFYTLWIEDSTIKDKSPSQIITEEEEKLGRQLSVDDKIAILKKEYTELRRQQLALMEEGAKGMGLEESDPQKIIEESDLAEYLKNGWMFVSQLASGKIVVRK
jgi:integrase